MAAKHEERGSALYEAGMERLRAIPFGQPILVGHYSEKADRSYRSRACATVERGFAETAKAQHYAEKAEAARKNRAISSDDPDAPDKLRERIEGLEARQERMKAINKIIQRKPKNMPTDEKIAALAGFLNVSEPTAARMFEPDCCGWIGHPTWELSNNSANIRRLKARLTQVEQAAAYREEVGEDGREEQHEGFTIREDVEDNRIRLLFPGKPDEATRAILKARGFRWSPYNSAWQRQLNNAGRWAAQEVARLLTA
jgi:hypothetical protein